MLELVAIFLGGLLLGVLLPNPFSKRKYSGTLYFVDSPYKGEQPMVGTIFNEPLDKLRERKQILLEVSQK